MNVGNPDEAFGLSFLPSDGVGLARLEFIILNAIPIHPMALVEYDTLEDLRCAPRSTGSRAGTPTNPRSSWTGSPRAWRRSPPRSTRAR